MESLRNGSESGPLVLNLLGISGWSLLHRLFEQDGLDKAMSQLQRYIASLTSMDLQDSIDFDESCETARKIGFVLDYTASGLDTPCVTPIAELSATSSSPPLSSVVCPVSSNPLIKMAFFSDEEREEANQIIQNAEASQNPPPHQDALGDFYVPIFPSRYVELELAAVDNTMWRIPSVNHPPPICIDMWAQWSGLSSADLEGCRQRAMDGTFCPRFMSWVRSGLCRLPPFNPPLSPSTASYFVSSAMST